VNDDQRDLMMIETHTDVKWLKNSLIKTEKDVEKLKAAHNKTAGILALVSLGASAATTWILGKLGIHL